MAGTRRGRVAVYVRSATGGPEGMVSLADQETACRAYVAAYDLGAVALFSEVGAGTEVGRVLRLLLTRAGEFDAVIVQRPDRLTREVGAYLRLCDRLEAAGTALRYADAPPR